MPKFLQNVDDSIYYIDPLELGSHSVSGVYLIAADGLTLIEVGTSINVPFILEAVRALGFKENDVKRVVVTHVHLDHAGGAGTLVKRLPHVKVHVHERGLKHLADPSKLLQSAEMVYGNAENVFAIHGEVLPVPQENLVAAAEGELDIGGGRRLKIFHTPGHAPHHLCAFEMLSRCAFSGEALGHYYPGTRILLPAVAPPSFDLHDSLDSIHKIAALEPQVICFSQFGRHREPSFVIEEAGRLLIDYGDLIRTSIGRGMDTADIVERMLAQLSNNPHAQTFSEQSIRGMLMSIVLGYYQYFQRAGIIS